MRVLHVLDHSLPILSGYSLRSHYVLRAQRQLRIDAIALTSPKHYSLAAEESIDGITYLRTPCAPGSRRARLAQQVQLMVQLTRRLARQVLERRTTLVHAHSPVLTGIAALWVARRAGIPIVYEVRALWEDAAVEHGAQRPGSPRYRLTRALEAWLLRRVDTVVAISKALGDEIARRGVPRAKIIQVPNGVDPEAFRPAPPDPHLVQRYNLQGSIVFGFVGSFNAYEGLPVLLRAFAALGRLVPNARLLLVGDGPAAAAVRADAEILGIAPRVTFAGAVPHNEVRRWYSVCDVLIYPRSSSRLTELTTPLKPLEAMAMGKAVVGSDVGGLRELIRHGDNGLLCRPNDAEDLARVLVEIARGPEQRRELGENARRSVADDRDWRHLATLYRHAYGKLLGAMPDLAGIPDPHTPRAQTGPIA